LFSFKPSAPKVVLLVFAAWPMALRRADPPTMQAAPRPVRRSCFKPAAGRLAFNRFNWHRPGRRRPESSPSAPPCLHTAVLRRRSAPLPSTKLVSSTTSTASRSDSASTAQAHNKSSATFVVRDHRYRSAINRCACQIRTPDPVRVSRETVQRDCWFGEPPCSDERLAGTRSWNQCHATTSPWPESPVGEGLSCTSRGTDSAICTLTCEDNSL
jgi:hypothetical protein